jgi:site-specific DNA-cytosine methylase
MLTGVEILLERMKTNPEEFIEGGLSKWSRVMDEGWSVMTAEEQKALQDGMNEAKREHFNGEVMRVLTQGHDDQLVRTDDYLVKQSKIPMQGNRPSATVSQNALLQAKSILSDEFDKAYAGQNTTSNPYQQRK